MTPYFWTPFIWRPYRSPRRLLSSLVPVLIILTSEIHAFSLKALLWIPSLHPWVTIRLTCWFLLALPAVHEWYEYVTAEEHESPDERLFRKIGPYAWLAIALCTLETAVVHKYGSQAGLFDNALGKEWVVGWFTFGVCAVGGLCWWQGAISGAILRRESEVGEPAGSEDGK